MESRTSIDIEFHSSDLAVVVLHGEHDLASVDQLALALALAGVGRFVLVDVVGASFVDSSTIHAIHGAAESVRRRGGALEVAVGVSGPVRRAFEMTGIQMLLPFHESRDEALASLEAAVLRAGDDTVPPDLPVDDSEAKTTSVRAHLGAQAASVVIRAEVTDAWETDTPPRRRAA